MQEKNKEFFNKIRVIDNVLASDKTSSDVLHIIKQKPYEDYFFNKVSSEIWFDILKKKGYFNAKNNPKPIPDKKDYGYKIPEWNVLTYLEKLSQNTRNLDEELLKIIKDASLYKDKDGYIDNYRTRWYFVKILLNIPLVNVQFNIFDKVIPTWLISAFDLTLPGADLANNLLPKYLEQVKNEEDIKKMERLVDVLLSIRKVKLKKSVIGKTYEIKTKIDNHWLEDSFITKNNAALIAQKCSNVPILNLATTIRKIFSKKYKKQDYSYIWLRDLTQEQQKSIHDGEYFLALVLRKLVVEKAKHNIMDGKEIIEKFLSDEYPHNLFKRLAILLIGENLNNYKMYLDHILANKKEKYFDHDSFLPELYNIFTKNAENITDEQRSKVVAIIEEGPTLYLPEEGIEEYKNAWKQRWYYNLRAIPEFKRRYESLTSIIKKDVVQEESDENREINFDKFPVSAEELLSKTNEEIVELIQKYKPKGEFPDYSPEGKYRIFQSAVEINPVKFTQNLEPFKMKNYHVLARLYNGLEEAWKQQKDINWENIMKFTLGLLQEDWFWNKENGKKSHEYGWTLSAIGDLIQEGCKTDAWAFPEKLHAEVEKIIHQLVTNLTNNNDLYQGDGVTHALNSSWGKVLTALIYLGLREARLSDKKDEKKQSKWSDTLKSTYEKSLTKKVYEAYTLLGQYLPNLHYIDKEWTENHVKDIHKINDEKAFETFMEGYLFTGNVYEVIYKLLKKSYERALTIEFEEKRIQERLIQHIAVGYLRGNEKLGENSLIDRLIKTDKQAYIREIINFLWHERDHILVKSSDLKVENQRKLFKKRILIFWDYVIHLLSKKKTISEEDEKTRSELAKLTIYISKLSEKEFKRLLFSAPYVTVDFDSTFFIEYLNGLKDTGDKDKSAEFVGKLFLAMLEGADELIPNYKWENIVSVVDHLYKIGRKNKKVKDLANQICIFYGERGNLGLRSLYEENIAIA